MYTAIPPVEEQLSRPKLERWSMVCPSLGDVFFCLDGQPILRNDRFKRDRRLPAVLKSDVVVAGDWIPGSSWGSSLANMLTKRSWDALRHPLIKQNNSICQVCGTAHDTLDVHEIWRYAKPPEHEIVKAKSHGYQVFGVQTLDSLAAICTDCHKFYHLGLAEVKGEIKPVLRRLGAINGWDSYQTWEYFRLVKKRWEYNSEFLWALDFSNIKHPDGGLTIKSNWVRDEEHPRLLVCKGSKFNNITALLNTPWRWDGDTDWQPIWTTQEFAEAE